MDKKGGTEGYIGKVVLMMIVVVIVLFMFNRFSGAGIRAIQPIATDNSAMACRMGYLGVGADPDKTCTPKLGDADGDCYPDSCDTCPDVHNELVDYGALRQAVLSGYSSADVASSKIEEILGDIGTSQEKPDRDNDHIPNICEATQMQVYNDRKKVWNTVKISDIGIPYKEPDMNDQCKFWYSNDQCCAQQGSSVSAFGINGENTNIKLEKPCLPHDKRPGK